jgi:hypothetical protein
MPDEPQDPIRIVAALRARGVNFVLVGGLAAATKGSTITTASVEVCLDDDQANLQRLGLALDDLGAIAMPGEEGDDHRVSFTSTAGRLTCVEVPGGYGDLQQRASVTDLGLGVVASVAAVEDLVDLARATGDLESAARLASYADEPTIVLESASEEGPTVERPKVTQRVLTALERVDTFLSDLDSRGLKRTKRP